ncbi:MAG: outer membrane beta-barrel protein [Betaproteobacteria bacterium]|nr:outer membrane beta-barrel protein [Betaproteobacteria bacterium]
MKMKPLAAALAIATLALGAAGVAQAADSGFVVKLGIADVVPKSNNGNLNTPLGTFGADVGDSVRPSITIEYMFTPNLGVEVLGAWPFRNDVKLKGVGSVGQVDVLPPTVSLQWHFLPQAVVSPFVGVGVNYAFMYRERTKGLLRDLDTNLAVKNSWGVAGHVGVDFNINKNWMVTLDARWIQMRNKVYLDIPNDQRYDLGKVKVDPMVWGISAGYRF